jgi:hypothetical protein
VAASITTIQGFGADQSPRRTTANSLTFRDPFTLKLRVDKQHYFEEEFPKIPYVDHDDVYLFKGDSFGVDLHIANGEIRGISYQANTNKAAISFRFTQEVEENGDAMMLLVIKNQTGRKLFMDALMTVPGKDAARSTSILPIKPGLVNYESWPHPIIELVLSNIRFQEQPATRDDYANSPRQPARSNTNSTSRVPSSLPKDH